MPLKFNQNGVRFFHHQKPALLRTNYAADTLTQDLKVRVFHQVRMAIRDRFQAGILNCTVDQCLDL